LWPVHVLRLQPTRRPAQPEVRGPRAEDALQQSLAELRARCAEQAAENTALRQRLADVTHELEALSTAGHGPARTGEDMTLLSQQLRDAEGQIELLKDLLLRDPAA
jgi:septal ring factor EnvC (AmiA/AmiB activator)